MDAKTTAFEKSSRVETEEEWVALVHCMAEGNQSALRVFYDRTYRSIMTSALRIVNNRETAEEVTMDVFLQVWFQASRYDSGRGSVMSWTMSLARSKAIDRFRFSQRSKRRSCDLEPFCSDTMARCDAENSLALRERKLLLERGLARLSPDERRTIEAAYLLELTHEEVAQKLGLPLGTVKTRIRVALAKLRMTFAPEPKERVREVCSQEDNAA